MLKLYNTLTRKIEEFKPLNPPSPRSAGQVGMYSCGPTVYGSTHIGHARSYIFVDTLKRVLTYNGYKVKHVMNLTDVGHLTEYDVEEQMKKSGKEKGTVWEIAQFYTREFFEVMGKLNILRADIVCKASEHVADQIELIQTLEAKGFTYQIDDGVYFDISKFPDYGKLARLKLDGQEPGARVDVNPQKKNPYDFALWKLTKPEEKRMMEWDSPWGRGVPGWHIECSSMAMKYLGETLDIHTGGEDLIPIHHTNEIAQSEAATGKPFVKYWLHNAHLIVEGERMSRSKGNFYTLGDIEEKGFIPLALRYLFLTSHYRQKMNFTWQGMASARVALGRLYELIRVWRQDGREVVSPEDVKKIDDFRIKFQEKIDNDLNLPEALAVVWEAAKSNIPDPDKLDLILDFDQVLGFRLEEVSKVAKVSKVSKGVAELVVKREELRREKKWQEADEIRKKIEELGYRIEDMPKGPKIKERLKKRDNSID